MIRSLYLPADGKLQSDLSLKEFAQALQDENGMLWVDFQGTSPEDDEVIMRETFHFHPLAIDDALQESHVPKLDDWGEYLYIVLHSVVLKKDNGSNQLDTLELDVFLGKNFIVTHHDLPINAVDRTWSAIQRDERHWQDGMDHLMYRLADEMVASYMPVVDQIDEEIDRTQDQIFADITPRILERILDLKRAVLHMRRILGPQREVLNRLARDEYAVIDSRDQVYFRDVYDHLVRLYDISESITDLVSSTIDTYLSVVNNRMNDVMKTLTVITTMFMPISFLAGFFGMNFFATPFPLAEWVSRAVFVVTFVLMIVIPVIMFLWVRRKGWM